MLEAYAGVDPVCDLDGDQRYTRHDWLRFAIGWSRDVPTPTPTPTP